MAQHSLNECDLKHLSLLRLEVQYSVLESLQAQALEDKLLINKQFCRPTSRRRLHSKPGCCTNPQPPPPPTSSITFILNSAVLSCAIFESYIAKQQQLLIRMSWKLTKSQYTFYQPMKCRCLTFPIIHTGLTKHRTEGDAPRATGEHFLALFLTVHHRR